MRLLVPSFVLSVCLAALAGCRSAAESDTPPYPAGLARPEVATAPVRAHDRVRGLTLDARDEPSPEVLAHLAELGVTHIALIPFGFQERHDDPALRFATEPDWFAESGRGARTLAAAGDTLGFAVILKPQLWLGRSDPDAWSATIGFETEAEWQAWEAAYRAFILHHAGVAADIESPLFVIGTELARAAREREAFWRRLIADVRRVYPGALTYAANWYDDFEHVPFWDALDYVGVQAYFPLAEAGGPVTPAALAAAWGAHKDALRRVADASGKPVLFTEVGYRSVGYAAAEPWRWPERGETAPPDTTLQRDLYTAMFTAFWHEPWFAGTLVWKWPVSNRRASAGPRGRQGLGFGIEGTPAERVLADWYRR